MSNNKAKTLDDTSMKKRKNVVSFEKNKKRRTAEAITTEMQELKATQEKMEFDEIGRQDHKIDCPMETQPCMTENDTTKNLINGPSCSNQNYKPNKKEQTNLKEKKPTPKEKIEFLEIGEQDRKIDCPMETQTCMTENNTTKNRTNDPFGPSCSYQKYKSNQKEQQNLNKKKPIRKEKSAIPFYSLLNLTKVEVSCESPATWPKYVGPKLKQKPGEKKLLSFRHLVFPDSSDSDQELYPHDGEPSAIPWEKSSTNLRVDFFSDSSSDFDIFNNDIPSKILTQNVEEKSFYGDIKLKNKPKELEE